MTMQPQRPRSRTEVIHYFSSPEELLHTIDAGDGRVRVADACARGRYVAHQCQGSSASQLAASLGAKVTFDSWTTSPGGVLCLAESDTRAGTVVVNHGLLRQIAVLLDEFAALGPWRRQEQVKEVVLAHEVYHLVTRGPARRTTEIEAHAFARRLLDMPFSPTLFGWAARQAQAGAGAVDDIRAKTTVKD